LSIPAQPPTGAGQKSPWWLPEKEVPIFVDLSC
jgi:hypothetical protein